MVASSSPQSIAMRLTRIGGSTPCLSPPNRVIKKALRQFGIQSVGTNMTINGKRIMIEGKVLRVAKLDPWFQQEWFEDVENPEMLIDALQKSRDCPDILTFWQRLPDTEPKIPLSHGTGFDRGASD